MGNKFEGYFSFWDKFPNIAAGPTLQLTWIYPGAMGVQIGNLNTAHWKSACGTCSVEDLMSVVAKGSVRKGKAICQGREISVIGVGASSRVTIRNQRYICNDREIHCYEITIYLFIYLFICLQYTPMWLDEPKYNSKSHPLWWCFDLWLNYI